MHDARFQKDFSLRIELFVNLSFNAFDIARFIGRLKQQVGEQFLVFLLEPG